MKEASKLRRVCLFVRAPELGRVKTRLARSLGHEAALRAYRQLVNHALNNLQPAAPVRRELWFAGASASHELQHWAQRWRGQLLAQAEGSLGTRMYEAVFAASEAAPGRECQAIVVGADCPNLDTALLDDAFNALDNGAQVTVAPAEDGGYGLIGVRWQRRLPRAATPFAGISWGSAAVFEQTAARCQALGLRMTALSPVWDVDELPDWERFVQIYGEALEQPTEPE